MKTAKEFLIEHAKGKAIDMLIDDGRYYNNTLAIARAMNEYANYKIKELNKKEMSSRKDLNDGFLYGFIVGMLGMLGFVL